MAGLITLRWFLPVNVFCSFTLTYSIFWEREAEKEGWGAG